MYNEYNIVSNANADILIAFLESDGFEAFEETAVGVKAYRLAAEHEQALLDIAALSEQFPLTFTVSGVEDKNWNEEWEKNFSPIQIGDLLGIRATFHAPMQGVQQELVIDPKMAFGTGHHATTYMVSELLFSIDLAGKRVLDYGCGTGILAILAKRLGAGFTWAVDIEYPSYENTLENAERNGVQLEVVTHGTLADVDERETFAVVLANINRNVILDSLASLYQRMQPAALLLVSGILAQDAVLVEEAAIRSGFSVNSHREREGWQAWVFQKA